MRVDCGASSILASRVVARGGGAGAMVVGSWLQPCLALADPPAKGTSLYPNEKGE